MKAHNGRGGKGEGGGKVRLVEDGELPAEAGASWERGGGARVPSRVISFRQRVGMWA